MDHPAGGGARFQFASDHSLLVYFEQLNDESRAQAKPLRSRITLQGNENVRKLLRLLESEPVAGGGNLHPAYCSLVVKFDAVGRRHEDLGAVLRKSVGRVYGVELPELLS